MLLNTQSHAQKYEKSIKTRSLSAQNMAAAACLSPGTHEHHSYQTAHHTKVFAIHLYTPLGLEY